MSKHGSPGLAHHGFGEKWTESNWLIFFGEPGNISIHNPAQPTQVDGLGGLTHELANYFLKR